MHQSRECTLPRVSLLAGYPLGEAAPLRVPLLACPAVLVRPGCHCLLVKQCRPNAPRWRVGLVKRRSDTLARSASEGSGPRRAFTLTEILVVITIIAVLASLVSVAVVRALDTAKQTRIKLEVDNIDAALKAYKEKYGSYPPCDLTNPATNLVLRQHVARVFPRYNLTNLTSDLPQAGVHAIDFRPDQALVFWLQGFSPDVANPFITPDGRRIVAGMPDMTKSTITPLFSFDPTRLYQVPSITSGVANAFIAPTFPTSLAAPAPLACYFPQGSVPPSSNAAPYVYWDAGATTVTTAGATTTVTSNYGSFLFNTPAPPVTLPVIFNRQNASATPASHQIFTNAGFAVPYWNDIGVTLGKLESTENWVNPDSFQIICAGQDGIYGNGNGTRLYPTGGALGNYDTSNNLGDDDNITNFCGKARLGDAKP